MEDLYKSSEQAEDSKLPLTAYNITPRFSGKLLVEDILRATLMGKKPFYLASMPRCVGKNMVLSEICETIKANPVNNVLIISNKK